MVTGSAQAVVVCAHLQIEVKVYPSNSGAQTLPVKPMGRKSSVLEINFAVSDVLELYLPLCNLCHGVTIKQQTSVIAWNCFGHIT